MYSRPMSRRRAKTSPGMLAIHHGGEHGQLVDHRDGGLTAPQQILADLTGDAPCHRAVDAHWRPVQHGLDQAAHQVGLPDRRQGLGQRLGVGAQSDVLDVFDQRANLRPGPRQPTSHLQLLDAVVHVLTHQLASTRPVLVAAFAIPRAVCRGWHHRGASRTPAFRTVRNRPRQPLGLVSAKLSEKIARTHVDSRPPIPWPKPHIRSGGAVGTPRAPGALRASALRRVQRQGFRVDRQRHQLAEPRQGQGEDAVTQAAVGGLGARARLDDLTDTPSGSKITTTGVGGSRCSNYRAVSSTPCRRTA